MIVCVLVQYLYLTVLTLPSPTCGYVTTIQICIDKLIFGKMLPPPSPHPKQQKKETTIK